MNVAALNGEKARTARKLTEGEAAESSESKVERWFSLDSNRQLLGPSNDDHFGFVRPSVVDVD